MSLSPIHKSFIAEYIRNGYNATQAYLSIKPKVSVRCAKVSGSRLLTRVDVKEALNSQIDKRLNSSIASREHLIQEAHDILLESKAEKHYQTALNAVEVKAKLNKLYDKAEPETEGYIKLIQMLQVNVSVEDQHQDNIINITPDDKVSTVDSDKG